ncbi:MAG TPA: hypothetical protein VJK50_02630 [Patescibacteria group bacterium]|nr:hypothetical protein [Patescibacteria group bacterium]
MRPFYTPKAEKIILALAVAGVLFSGYLSAVKFFTKGCALNEPCPYVLGYPACWYGLAMYLAIFIAALLSDLGYAAAVRAHRFIFGMSGLGILFSGYVIWGELPALLVRGLRAYTLGLPSCAYGLIMFVMISILSWRVVRASARSALS